MRRVAEVGRVGQAVVEAAARVEVELRSAGQGGDAGVRSGGNGGGRHGEGEGG